MDEPAHPRFDAGEHTPRPWTRGEGGAASQVPTGPAGGGRAWPGRNPLPPPERPPGVLWTELVLWLLVGLLPGMLNLLVVLSGGLPARAPNANVELDAAAVGLVLSLVFGWAPVIGVGWMLHARGRGWGDIGLTPLRGRDIGWGALLSVVSWVLVFVLGIVFSRLGMREVEFLPRGLPVWFLVVNLAAISVTAGVTEEVLFRGYAQTRLEQLGMPAAVILLLPTGLWGVLHGYQGWGAAATIFCLGVLYAALFHRTRRLWPIIIAHMLFDATQLVIYLLVRL